ncbi:hypothetical protein Geu3261_0140_029 [Komagataeibacter europaeus NBRC 3261]|uniref:Uncharacterized protein n=1 Tax=Komagataeibacter europaeus NBRC 3261 TaxID=1234669 RepID=A0A0D6Q0I4_KOMEU|nr:hypothetical protein Geu3261_0140_029 [Komagataeibacter europaeus NBRC 3261]
MTQSAGVERLPAFEVGQKQPRGGKTPQVGSWCDRAIHNGGLREGRRNGPGTPLSRAGTTRPKTALSLPAPSNGDSMGLEAATISP